MARVRVCGECWQPVASCVCPDEDDIKDLTEGEPE